MLNCFLFIVSGKCDNRVRLFTFLSTEGPFLAKEILNQTRSDHVSPYPFRQANLYDATQPGNVMYCGINLRLIISVQLCEEVNIFHQYRK